MPGPVAWSSTARRRYSSLGPPRHRRFPCQPGFERGPRLASPWTPSEDKGSRRSAAGGPFGAQSRRRTPRWPSPHSPQAGTGPASWTRGSSLRANQIAFPKAQHSRSAASRDATSRCPIHGQPRRYPGVIDVGSVKNRMKPAGKPAMSPAHLTRRRHPGRELRPRPPVRQGKRQSPSIAAASSCSTRSRSPGRG